MKTELPPEHVSTGKSLRLKLYGNGAVKELTGVSAKPSEIARHIIRRFNFRGYDGSLWVEVYDKDDGYHQAGDLKAGFSKEFRNCGNGYYYLLINEQTFIGCDID